MTDPADMSKRYLRLRGAADTASIRTAQFMGRDHVVVPVVALIGGAVVRPMGSKGPEYVPAEELSLVPGSWNGRPVVPDHPTNAAGGPISASESPEVLEANQFGIIHNARYEDGRLKMDAYIDGSRAQELGGDALSALTRAQAGEDVEVSVGAWVYADEESGTSPDGVEYQYIWREIVPDHLAMLPEGDIGACSVEMGCGAPRVAKGDRRKRSMSLKAAKEEEIAKTLLAIEPDADIKVASDEAGTVIYSMSGKHYQRMMGEEGLAEPVEVLAVVDYQPIGEGLSDIVYTTTDDGNKLAVDESMTTASTNACQCQKGKDKPMADNTESAVDKLIAASASPFTEEHRKGLADLGASALKNMCSRYLSEDSGEAEEPDEPAAAKPEPIAEPESAEETAEDVVQLSREEYEDIKAAAAEHKAEQKRQKDALVASLKGAQDAYTEEQLKAKDIGDLRSLSKALKVEQPAQNVDFSVRPLHRENSEEADVYLKPPDPWELAIAKRNGAEKPAGGAN